MAISHAQPLLLLLLMSLFGLPALGLRFRECPFYQNAPALVDNVTIAPDPVKYKQNVNLTITAHTTKNIDAGATVLLAWRSPVPLVLDSVITLSLCNVTACPVAPGTFVLTFPNVFPAKELTKERYNMDVYIQEKPLTKPIMCVRIDGSIVK